MTKYALSKYIENANVPQSTRQAYEKEAKQVKKKYTRSLSSRLGEAIFDLFFPGGLIYFLVVGVFLALLYLPEISDTFYRWSDHTLYTIILFILLIAGVVLTFKSFGYIYEVFSFSLSNRGSEYETKKSELIAKYNEMGYYPQYKTLRDVHERERQCAYRDDYTGDYRCPLDDSLVSISDRKCFSPDFSTCKECEKLKKEFRLL